MLAGRAMTLAYLSDVGSGAAGAPPQAWLMPLLGDALIGITALPVAYLIWRGAGLFAWTTIIVWNALAIWDALSAFIIHMTVPWPTFFMVEAFGSSMFFAAAAMHAACIYFMALPARRQEFLGGER